MIISRRQRDSLLDEVSRMLANKQNVAFANHAKIADRISNGDNALYIDSTKKEFVMKYGNNNIRFSAKDKQISDINNILFSNNSTIEGITSNPVSNAQLLKVLLQTQLVTINYRFQQNGLITIIKIL